MYTGLIKGKMKGRWVNMGGGLVPETDERQGHSFQNAPKIQNVLRNRKKTLQEEF